MKTSDLQRWSFAWNSKGMAALIIFAFAVLAAKLSMCVPSPGIAVALLACAAGIASVRDNNWLERLIWSAIFSGLLWTEVRAIKIDRHDNDVKQAQFFRDQQASFKKISDDASQHFERTMSSLEDDLQETRQASVAANKSALLARQSILEITGGDSFAFIYPSAKGTIGFPITNYSIKIHNAGNQRLMGTVVEVYEVIGTDGAMRSIPQEDVGTLAPHEGRMIKMSLSEPSNAHLHVFVTSQTPGITEDIYFRPPTKLNEPPEFRFTVTRIIWQNPRKTDLKEGKHWIRTLKKQDWVGDYDEPDIFTGPPRH